MLNLLLSHQELWVNSLEPCLVLAAQDRCLLLSSVNPMPWDQCPDLQADWDQREHLAQVAQGRCLLRSSVSLTPWDR